MLESPREFSNQLENQINQDNLKELENNILDLENKIDAKIDTLQNQNSDLNQRLQSIESQPSFDDQFVSSTEYTKLMDRLYKLENKDGFEISQWIQIFTGIGTVGGFAVLGYQAWVLRTEKNLTMRAWLGASDSTLDIFSYINDQGDEKTHEQMIELQNADQIFNWTGIQRAIWIKNYGYITAREVKMRARFNAGKKPDIKNIHMSKFPETYVTMVPNSTQAMTFKFTKEQENMISNPSVETYFLFELLYKSANSNKERIMGMLIQLYPTRYAVLTSWDESNQP